jgi:hypothetical protein
MRVAHLIITYTSPLQTERMIRSMQHPDFDFYIHVDKKVDISSHLFLAGIPQVYLIDNRTDVVWAGYNTIKATIRSVEEILASGKKYDYIHLMSGQDYPIKPANQVHDFFVKHNGHEFLEFEHFDKWSDEAYPRIQQYHLTNYRFPGRYQFQWLMNKLLPSRVSPVQMEYFGSSMFWALTPMCLRYVIDFLKSNPKFQRFMHFTWGADEFLFQTLVLNSSFKTNVLNNNLLFLDRGKGEAHPNIITTAHYQAMLQSEKLFARKFDQSVDVSIMDMLDRHFVDSQAKPVQMRVAGAGH